MMTDATKLIALDWGTSSLRCYRFGNRGEALERRSFELGVLEVSTSSGDSKPEDRARAFEQAFSRACGDWVDAAPDAPVLACGMVGSSIGWREILYLDVPIDVGRIAASLADIRASSGKVLHVVPGLLQRGTLPDVMRGEETQVVGVLSYICECNPHDTRKKEDVLIGLPGTHSKWVLVSGATIRRFETFMTGELFRLLCEHSILGRAMRRIESAIDYPAFDRGVQVARESADAGGLLSTMFSVRTLGLAGDLSPEQQPEYLSGLIIGEEIAALVRLETKRGDLRQNACPRILLAGEPSLCARYARALRAFGCNDAEFVPDAAERGLWTIASQAALVSNSAEFH